MKVDTLIVGFGISGLNYAEQLRQHNKSFIVISPLHESASLLAAGIINPFVLKRFNPVWKSEAFLNFALPTYKNLENLVGEKVFHNLPIYRILNNIHEQNEWRVAASKPQLEKYLKAQLISPERQSQIRAPFNFGQVIQSARVDNKRLLKHYIKKIIPDQFLVEKLDYKLLVVQKKFLQYKNIKAKKIVFCEGFHSHKNPYFKYLPLIGSKGEILTIRCESLTEKIIFKGPIFLSPIGGHKFWVGATFDREDKTTNTTQKGKEWLCSKLNQFLKLPFQILDHNAQIRATVIDRRPLLGQHPQYDNLFILNGVGTRGVLMSPLLSYWLFDFIENKTKLSTEVDIKRFENKYFRKLKN